MKELMKGNEALARAAVYAGMKCYFGYPITPQTEIAEYLAKKMPEVGGVFLQAESEISAINMVYGAAGAGVRVMTSSSGPGISLKQEGISALAAADLPCVIVNVMRAAPGLGGISAAQSDYYQAVKGGGHGDYHVLVFAPQNVQEMAEMTVNAFNYADRWRMPTMILADGVIGQMMETVDFSCMPEPEFKEKPWAATGRGDREHRNIVKTLYLKPEEMEKIILKRDEKYKKIESALQDWEEYMTDDADIIVTAYGVSARIARSAVNRARQEGIAVGLIRPKMLYPFPKRAFMRDMKKVLCVEMSRGQMVDDVRLAVDGRAKVEFYGRCGGMLVEEDEILSILRRMNNADDI